MNELTIVIDDAFVVERSGSLLDRLRGEKVY